MKCLIFIALILNSCESITHKYYINITNFSSEPAFVIVKQTPWIGNDLNKEISLEVDENKLIYLGEQNVGSYRFGNDKTEDVNCEVMFDLDETFEKTLCQENVEQYATNYYIYDEGENCHKGEKVYYQEMRHNR